MIKKVVFISAMVLGGSMAACSSTDSGTPAATAEMTGDQAKQKAIALVPGAAGEPTKIDSATERRWSIVVKPTGGGEVVVEFERVDGRLAEMKAEKGPFEYELPAPHAGFLPYKEARAKALATKAGAVEVWEVDVAKTQWEFYVRDANARLWEVKMNASTGAITEVEEKDRPD